MGSDASGPEGTTPAGEGTELRALQSGNDERTLAALELVLTQQRVVFARAPVGLGRNSNSEIRIKFFKALPFLQVDGDIPLALQAGLEDAARAEALRAMGLDQDGDRRIASRRGGRIRALARLP